MTYPALTAVQAAAEVAQHWGPITTPIWTALVESDSDDHAVTIAGVFALPVEYNHDQLCVPPRMVDVLMGYAQGLGYDVTWHGEDIAVLHRKDTCAVGVWTTDGAGSWGAADIFTILGLPITRA